MVGMARKGIGKKIGLGALAAIGVGVLVLYTTSFGKGLRDVWSTGAVQAMTKKHVDGTYSAESSVDNLKALSTGLKSYESSEGQYPDAAKWMDQLSPRLILNNLPKAEAEKKLVRPDLVGQEGAYGYAFNDAAAGKYRGDLAKGTILLFESAATGRNAHGDPTTDGKPGGSALTIDGTIVALKRS